ncbi:hypothetical protein GMD78_17325 [Ornithinibacillus sp. L9]|uniref:Uncharacterized protein n=1 Tax=Ornithinibacillus caprae TaxID=2678566 RepID=A0A6N8FPP3_9BACI|nr:hypothetical protein [Ornithinibacillus caprae]MUK90137.1 hypothetical protein [Ornithinibacillus caprae]
MNKKKWLKITILVGIIISSSIVLYLSERSQQEQKDNLKKDTISYLGDQGYDEKNDVKEIVIVDLSEQLDNEEFEKYQAVVLLEGKPDNLHVYTYKKNTNEVIKIDFENEEFVE